MEISRAELERLIDERARKLTDERLRALGLDTDHPTEQILDGHFIRRQRLAADATGTLLKKTFIGAIVLAFLGFLGWAIEQWIRTRPPLG